MQLLRVACADAQAVGQVVASSRVRTRDRTAALEGAPHAVAESAATLAAKPAGFLMYPQGETGGRRLNSLDASAFRYTITSRELTA